MSQLISGMSPPARNRSFDATSGTRTPGLMALEPRMLFDGAVGATADAVVDLVDLPAAADEVVKPAVDATFELPQDDPVLTIATIGNQAPVANDDVRNAPHDSGPIYGNVITAGAPGEVADFDPDGDQFAVFGVTTGATDQVPLGHVGTPLEGQFGTLTLFDDGSYNYTPNADVGALGPGESAQDVFSCLVCDDVGNTDTSTLTFNFANAAAVPGGPGDPGDPADPGNPVNPGNPDGGGNEPPVFVSPPVEQPSFPVPLPPDSGTGALPPVVSDGSLVTAPDGSAAALASPYTLLTPDSGKPVSAFSTDAFAPFAPAAVLGMVETAPDRDANLAKLGIAPVAVSDQAAGEECAKPKPNVVNRAAEGAQAKGFSDTVRSNAKPAPGHRGDGSNC